MSDFPPLPQTGGKRSFRLGVTSYVYPADLSPNIRLLAPFVDDIELVFFESKEHCNFPDPAAVDEWHRLADEHHLTYTVHFPIDKAIGSPNPAERQSFVAVAERLIELCQPLNPHGWILHLEGITPDATPDRVTAWQNEIRPHLQQLTNLIGDPSLFCVENLGYPFEWCEPLLSEFPLGVCLDFGHLWQMQYDWKSHVAKWLPRTRIIHLYGTDHSSRHYSLEKSPAPLVREALDSIGDYNGVLTLETFGLDDTASSLKCLQQYLAV